MHISARPTRNVLLMLVPTFAILVILVIAGSSLQNVINLPPEPYNPGTPTPVSRPEGEFAGEVDWTHKVRLPFISRYIVDLPPGYDPNSDQKYALIVYFHSASGTGRSFNSFRTIERSQALRDANDRYPTIVLYPHIPSQTITWMQMMGAVDELVDRIIQEYPIDPERVYALGFSDGGYGALAAGVRFPERYAAVAEIGGYFTDIKTLCALKDTPVYIYHGDKDEVISVDYAYAIQKELEACSNLLTVNILAGKNHLESADATLNSIELYNNLFSNTLKQVR